MFVSNSPPPYPGVTGASYPVGAGFSGATGAAGAPPGYPGSPSAPPPGYPGGFTPATAPTGMSAAGNFNQYNYI